MIDKQEHLLSQKDVAIDYFDDKNGEITTNASTEINETINYITQNNMNSLIQTFKQQVFLQL